MYGFKMVIHGYLWLTYKGGTWLKFKTFFNILKNRISNGEDVPSFMGHLISSITDIPEKDWDAKKDPNNRVNDNTLRNY